MKRFWKNYNLSIVLGLCFVLSLAGQFFVGLKHFRAEQSEHGQGARIWGDDGYIWAFGDAVLENWQSEFLQLLTFVIFTTYLVHKGSHESKDTEDAMQAQLDRIEARLSQLSANAKP